MKGLAHLYKQEALLLSAYSSDFSSSSSDEEDEGEWSEWEDDLWAKDDNLWCVLLCLKKFELFSPEIPEILES